MHIHRYLQLKNSLWLMHTHPFLFDLFKKNFFFNYLKLFKTFSFFNHHHFHLFSTHTFREKDTHYSSDDFFGRFLMINLRSAKNSLIDKNVSLETHWETKKLIIF